MSTIYWPGQQVRLRARATPKADPAGDSPSLPAPADVTLTVRQDGGAVIATVTGDDLSYTDADDDTYRDYWYELALDQGVYQVRWIGTGSGAVQYAVTVRENNVE